MRKFMRALSLAIIENIQREDLTPIEEARGIARLIDEFSMTHREVAEVVGRSRPAISNLLRLLELNADVREWLEAGELEMGHARALLALAEREQDRRFISVDPNVRTNGFPGLRRPGRRQLHPARGSPSGPRMPMCPRCPSRRLRHAPESDAPSG